MPLKSIGSCRWTTASTILQYKPRFPLLGSNNFQNTHFLINLFLILSLLELTFTTKFISKTNWQRLCHNLKLILKTSQINLMKCLNRKNDKNKFIRSSTSLLYKVLAKLFSNWNKRHEKRQKERACLSGEMESKWEIKMQSSTVLKIIIYSCSKNYNRLWRKCSRLMMLIIVELWKANK